jgi:hypothetical protein
MAGGSAIRVGRALADDLILGMAAGYEPRLLEPFVFSLRRVGFRGHCRLYVRRYDVDAGEFLAANGIEVVPFDSMYERLWHVGKGLRLPRRVVRIVEFIWLRLLQGFVTWPGSPKERPGMVRLYRQAAPLFFTSLRYLMYYEHLATVPVGRYRRILLTDVRDVFFQRDPFDFPGLTWGVSCFLEDDSMSIRQCSWTSDWIRYGYGKKALEEMRNLPIFCSATIMGDHEGLLAYLQAMIGEIARTAGWPGLHAFGADQGNHNYLLHRAPSFRYTAMHNGAAPVMHVNLRKRERLGFSPEGLLLNDDGSVVNVVHQWDQHRDAFAEQIEEIRKSGGRPPRDCRALSLG